MSESQRKLPVTNILFLSFFVIILIYFLNYTPERTFAKPKCLEIIMIDTSLIENKHKNRWELKMREELRSSVKEMFDGNLIITYKLNGNQFFDQFMLKEVLLLNRLIRIKEAHNLVLRVSFSKNNRYEDFIQCQNFAMMEGVQCYTMLDYDFYFYNCK